MKGLPIGQRLPASTQHEVPASSAHRRVGGKTPYSPQRIDLERLTDWLGEQLERLHHEANVPDLETHLKKHAEQEFFRQRVYPLFRTLTCGLLDAATERQRSLRREGGWLVYSNARVDVEVYALPDGTFVLHRWSKAAWRPYPPQHLATLPRLTVGQLAALRRNLP